MRFLISYIRFVDCLNDRVGKVFSFFIYAITLILVYEVVMRYAFNSPTIWAHETSEFFYAAHFLIGGAFALRWGAHVNIDAIYKYFPPRRRAIVDLFTWLVFYLFCGVLLWRAMAIAIDSVKIMEHTESVWAPPFWPVKLTIPLAAVLLILGGLTKTIKDSYTAITGRDLIVEVSKGGQSC
jgi:TRAP-type mannitol/chloroaromatic compound transport system permease small subunit